MAASPAARLGGLFKLRKAYGWCWLSVSHRDPQACWWPSCAKCPPAWMLLNVHLVLLGTQAVVEGGQLPGDKLAHFWGQRHEGHIPTVTSVSAPTQNSLFQMDDLCHQQHETSFKSINVKLRLRFDIHLTFHWHSTDIHLNLTWPPDHHLTFPWPLQDPYLT